jgi:hypothetical protein
MYLYIDLNYLYNLVKARSVGMLIALAFFDKVFTPIPVILEDSFGKVQ